MAKEWVISEEDLGCDGAYLSHEEVIRCRDCENLMKSDDNFEDEKPYYYCDIFNHMINPDDFCSRAKRRKT